MHKDNQERIDAYLRGEMNTEQKRLFRNELADNEELRKEYLLTKSIVKALCDREEKIDLMKQWSEEEEEDVPMVAAACAATQRTDMKVVSINPKFRILKWVYGIGAAACIAVGIFAIKSLFFTTSSSDGRYMMPNFSAEAIYRSSNSDLSSLDSLITTKNYAAALSSVDLLINEADKQLQVYEAKDSLTERDEYKIEQYKANLYELEWRKIHLLLALDKKEEAIHRLIRFSSQDGAYRFEADSLLKTLKTIKR